MQKLGRLSLLFVFSIFSSCSEEARTGPAAALATIMGAVETNFAPDTLSASSTALAAQDGDPCADTGVSGLENLFACQPILLRLYVDIAKTIISAMKTIVGEVNTNLGEIADGASGTLTNGTTTFVYSKTSSDVYKIIVQNAGVPAMYVSATATGYEIQFDAAANDPTSGDATKAKVSLSYTDENSWAADMTMEMACSADDVRAPNRIRIYIAKANGLWSGKAQIYNGVWASGLGTSSDPTCDTVATDDISMAMYTDFVGDALAAKAKVYMMKRSIDSTDAFATYPLNAFLTTYASNLNVDLSAYDNPFCNKADSMLATWGATATTDCTALSAAVGAAEYGLATIWSTPSTFYQEAITLPTTIE